MRFTWATAALAVALFLPLFTRRSLGGLDFWWWLAANLVLLTALVAFLDADWRRAIHQDLKTAALRKIALGVLSALGLYVLFLGGNFLSRLMFPFAADGIAEIYGFKSSVSPARITLLMLLIIGPGEELFWRGFLQSRLQQEQGPWPGFLLATALYTLVHIGSGNAMLVLAAAVCGLFWGFLYLRYNSLLLNVVSHTLWDITIFLLFPVT